MAPDPLLIIHKDVSTADTAAIVMALAAVGAAALQIDLRDRQTSAYQVAAARFLAITEQLRAKYGRCVVGDPTTRVSVRPATTVQ